MGSSTLPKRQLQRYEGMVFDYRTTHRTDFQEPTGKTEPCARPEPESKPIPPLEVKPHKVLHTETFTPFSNKIPFDLFWKPKGITRDKPFEYVLGRPNTCKKDDSARLEAQRTRPRLIISPALSLDDVEDPTTRNIVLEDTYTSTWTKACREQGSIDPGVKAPLDTSYTISGVMDTFPRYKPPQVDDEWKKESMKWDRKQLRAHVDPTKEFWLNRRK